MIFFKPISSASYEDFASIDGLEKPIAFAEGDSV
jgi:hypothetical protein